MLAATISISSIARFLPRHVRGPASKEKNLKAEIFCSLLVTGSIHRSGLNSVASGPQTTTSRSAFFDSLGTDGYKQCFVQGCLQFWELML
ncbi:hypothetical protein Poli38472_005313 [Pythium oligandrum]|uniref:Uncharacterized protein n=1 Tax=Pythium oligandrum TaxID=41045 RepID=A0A8K1CGB3_PYTOL|nr:hypothetical protein Poli38472_005313 [Pythium oligandrum]|eukprot:TMW62695.1 hypothetical protein Poli38472_005313 [Pythium oligandrum]